MRSGTLGRPPRVAAGAVPRQVAAIRRVPHHSPSMPASLRCPRARPALALALALILLAFGAQAAGPKRVLILHSFGRDFAPYDTIAAVFRTELARRSPDPVTFAEVSLDFGRMGSEVEQRAFLDYLRARYGGAPPDAVVTVGPPAARFYVGHRGELFGDTPVIVGALDERLAKGFALQPRDAIVAGKVDLPQLFDNILGLLPDTTTIALVVGASELERFWTDELRRELAQFEGRVKFEWLNELSLAQMRERVASLPPHSAVLFGLLIVDAAGVPHERQDALVTLRAATSAPIFSIYENEIGHGVVGGPYSSQRKNGERIALATLVALDSTAPARTQVYVDAFEPPVYDARELERWGIDRSRLPQGSEVRFERASLWQEHRVAVIVAATGLTLQAALIAALLVQRARRRRAEQEARGLAGRLVTAHEDERRRIARELHDDVTQRLAGLAIEAAELESRTKGTGAGETVHAIRDGLVGLGEDVHALSYRLHPSVIEDLGLVEALRIECDRIARRTLQVKFDCRDVPRKLPSEAALCLFRVAQEALRNVERHAGAGSVAVSVVGRDGGVAVSVHDDGAGFDAASKGERTSLGLASMRERVRTLHGRLDIASERGSGTRVSAWVPLAEAA